MGSIHSTVADGAGTLLSPRRKHGSAVPRAVASNISIPEVSLDDIQLFENIGWGATGVVRRGVHDNREVAVKVFFPHADEALFEKELRNWMAISHPNIVQVRAACLEEGNLAMVMELMRCGSLYDYLHSDVRRAAAAAARSSLTHSLTPSAATSWHGLEPANLLARSLAPTPTPTQSAENLSSTWPLLYRISIDICSAMIYLHNNGYTHRDLKASNVLLSSLDPYSSDPVAKLCDFGDTRKMARAMTPKVGTVPYMVRHLHPFIHPSIHTVDPSTDSFVYAHRLTAPVSSRYLCRQAPEIFQQDSYTGKVDVYSFGVLLWEMITRQEPYHDIGFATEIFSRVAQGYRPPIPADCPPIIAQLIASCWENNPDDRPNFSGILDRLKNIGQMWERLEVGKLLQDIEPPTARSSSTSGSSSVLDGATGVVIGSGGGSAAGGGGGTSPSQSRLRAHPKLHVVDDSPINAQDILDLASGESTIDDISLPYVTDMELASEDDDEDDFTGIAKRIRESQRRKAASSDSDEAPPLKSAATATASSSASAASSTMAARSSGGGGGGGAPAITGRTRASTSGAGTKASAALLDDAACEREQEMDPAALDGKKPLRKRHKSKIAGISPANSPKRKHRRSGSDNNDNNTDGTPVPPITISVVDTDTGQILKSKDDVAKVRSPRQRSSSKSRRSKVMSVDMGAPTSSSSWPSLADSGGASRSAIATPKSNATTTTAAVVTTSTPSTATATTPSDDVSLPLPPTAAAAAASASAAAAAAIATPLSSTPSIEPTSPDAHSTTSTSSTSTSTPTSPSNSHIGGAGGSSSSLLSSSSSSSTSSLAETLAASVSPNAAATMLLSRAPSARAELVPISDLLPPSATNATDATDSVVTEDEHESSGAVAHRVNRRPKGRRSSDPDPMIPLAKSRVMAVAKTPTIRIADKSRVSGLLQLSAAFDQPSTAQERPKQPSSLRNSSGLVAAASPSSSTSTSSSSSSSLAQQQRSSGARIVPPPLVLPPAGSSDLVSTATKAGGTRPMVLSAPPLSARPSSEKRTIFNSLAKRNNNLQTLLLEDQTTPEENDSETGIFVAQVLRAALQRQTTSVRRLRANADWLTAALQHERAKRKAIEKQLLTQELIHQHSILSLSYDPTYRSPLSADAQLNSRLSCACVCVECQARKTENSLPASDL